MLGWRGGGRRGRTRGLGHVIIPLSSTAILNSQSVSSQLSPQLSLQTKSLHSSMKGGDRREGNVSIMTQLYDRSVPVSQPAI